MNLLGIGSQSESVIIKGQNFEQMKNLADDIRTYVDDLTTIDSVNSMSRTISRRFSCILIWIISAGTISIS